MRPSKKQQIITGILMSAGMAFSLSGFFSALYVGWSASLPDVWASNFIKGWPVGFIVSALIAGPVQRLAARLAGVHPGSRRSHPPLLLLAAPVLALPSLDRDNPADPRADAVPCRLLRHG